MEVLWAKLKVKKKKKRLTSSGVSREPRGERRLFILLLFLLIALLADLVFFGRFGAALVRAFLALSNGLVAAGSIFLTLFTGLLFLVSLDAAFVLTILPLGLGFDATALVGEDGARPHEQSHRERQSRQRFHYVHCVPFLRF